MQRAATWVFVLAFFVFSIRLPDGSQRSLGTALAEVAVLAACTVAMLIRPNRGAAVARVALVAFVLELVVIGYYAFQAPPRWGDPGRYVLWSVYYFGLITLVASFATFFYDRDVFADVFWKVARWSLIVAVVGLALTAVTDTPVLTHTQYGTPRLQGLLSEPSAWAPVLPAVFLLAWRRGSRRMAALALVAAVLTKSPTVLLVFAVAVALYFVLTAPWRSTKIPILLTLGLAVPVVMGTFNVADPDQYIASGNTATVVVGRVASGISYVRSGGLSGQNERFRSTKVVLDHLRWNGKSGMGFGLGSSDVYFHAAYPPPSTLQPNSFVVWTWFGLGQYAAWALIALMLATLARLRRDPLAAAIFIPFLVAAAVNSAEGMQGYKFALVAIFCYGLGWVHRAASRRAPEVAETVSSYVMAS